MTSNWWLAAARVVLGLLAMAAISRLIVVRSQLGGFHAVHFFSYFTILSNLYAALLLLSAGVSRRSASAMLRGAAVVYMGVTGLVFALVLARLAGDFILEVPAANAMLHDIMPVAVALDWLIDPPGARIELWRSMWWLTFSTVYVVYILVQGAVTGWYPYPFLNPNLHGGYPRVAVSIVVIGLGIVVLSLVVAAAGNALGARRSKTANA